MESVAALGRVDSIAPPKLWSESSAQRATTATLLVPMVVSALAQCSLRAGSVVLKNETG